MLLESAFISYFSEIFVQIWLLFRKVMQENKSGCFFLNTVYTYNTNNNNQDNVYGAIIMAEPLREFIRFI